MKMGPGVAFVEVVITVIVFEVVVVVVGTGIHPSPIPDEQPRSEDLPF